jgi:predicted O-methyltransferase YrrM
MMNVERWTAVDRYFVSLFAPDDDALAAAQASAEAAGLPPISVTPLQGKLLMLLAAACRAERILEIGTLGAYSTIWLARALPLGGRVVTIESEPAHAKAAAANIVRAGLAERIDLRCGSALDVLPQLGAEGADPFDLIFIDADKRLYADFFRAALPLARSGALIIADNVVRQGGVSDAENADPRVAGVRRFLAAVADEPRVSATVMQTVGAKGYDGWLLAVVE